MATQERFQILSQKRIDRILRRIAFQIVEDNQQNLPVYICGIDERGFALANLLKANLEEIIPTEVPTVSLPVKREKNIPDLKKADASFCILIDDVIFSGSTMFRGVSMIHEQANPKFLKIAALVDRGHRQYPVEAHYTGIVSPTKLNEHVDCQFDENDFPSSVVLERK